jgi:Domain of unknown function (DUF4175)
MWNPMRRTEESGGLVDIIHDVRRRWRYKLALRGAVGVLGLGVGVLLLAAFGLESWRFSAGSIVTFRIVLGLALTALVAWFLVRPLMRRVSDEQVALYLEEHEPSLQAAIVSAVEVDAAGRASSAASPHSAALVRRLVESAVEKCQTIDRGRAVERRPVRRYAGTIAAIAACTVAVFVLGPAYLRHALSALLIVSRSVEAAAPYRIEVTPGNATVPRGVDQTITAKLDGFDAEQAALMVRKAPDAPFERMTLLRSEAATDLHQYEGMLFDLAGPIDYFVEAAGVRSPTFTLKVVDLPYVQKLQLEYHFPAYTGLEPRKVEDGGDIAVLKGTEVRVHVVPTMTSPGGQILLHDKDTAALAPATNGLDGKFVADRDGFYRIELDAPTGERVTASPQYTIDVLADQPPTVSIAKPGRDTSASPIEEVFVEARAEDDYGVKDLDLVYSVNGGAEKTLRLFDGKNRLTEVTAGHTFYLEELSVQPGDFVSYYARAADNDGVAGAKRTTSDLYFLQIRPLRKEFKRAESNAGGGGGGGQQVGALSQQQRQIIAATFNINRDRKTMAADKLRENSTVIALSQAKLRDQVDGLVTRMNSRLIQQDPAFKKVAELLPQAVTEMKSAEAKLQQASPDGAIPFEQKALQILQKAEEEYEVQVSMQRQQGGGGGGGQSQMAEDLADLFELEMDKMANQYETAHRAQQQQSDQKVDELAEKLKELARRQEQEAERLRQRAAAGQQAAGNGGASQRDLANQVEEAARRLEQLSREENRPDLMDSARRMREAADQMRQAAANGGQMSAAQATSALQRLQEAQRKLQQAQSARGTRDVTDAQRQAEEMAREQQQIAEGVKGLEGTPVESRVDKIQQLSDRKETLESKAAALENQLDKTASDMRRTDPDAARKLSDAARGMRDSRLRDTIRYTRSQIRAGVQGSEVTDLEQRIGSSLDDLRKRLGDAASSVGNSRPDAMGDALDKAQQVARGLQSLDQRTRERTGQGRQGQQGQQGQAGQQQGRQGQSGQQGQQGQGQQGQGQQGQQGQGGRQAQGGQQGGNGGRNDGAPTNGGRNGDGDTYGPFQPGAAGGSGDRRNNGSTFTPGDVRQFRGEVRQYTGQVEQLRRALQGQRMDSRDLDEVLRGLRRLDDDRVYQDASELTRLQSQVADSMKRFEYALRRKVEGDANQVLLSGSDEVPEQFRKLVEQYYRSLSKAPEKAGDKAPDKAPDKK